MHLPWMSRPDRKRWRAAQDIGQLGELMARWLEGDIASRVGYAPRYGPEDETRDLVPTLAALCRAGFVTTDSQPGMTGYGHDWSWWEQRAAVTGVLTDRDLLHRFVNAAVQDRLRVRVNNYSRNPGIQDPPLTVTTREGEAMTTFGGPARRMDRACQWQGLNRQLHNQVVNGIYLTLAAPEYGTRGERLWALLDDLSGLRTAPTAPHDS